MTVCETCWKVAATRAMARGGSVVDHYYQVLEERKDNPCSQGAAPTTGTSVPKGTG